MEYNGLYRKTIDNIASNFEPDPERRKVEVEPSDRGPKVVARVLVQVEGNGFVSGVWRDLHEYYGIPDAKTE